MEFIRLDANLYLETNAEFIRVEPMVEGVTLYLSRCPNLRSVAIATTKHSVIEYLDGEPVIAEKQTIMSFNVAISHDAPKIMTLIRPYSLLFDDFPFKFRRGQMYAIVRSANYYLCEQLSAAETSRSILQGL